jgi:hypothetical protein
VFYEVQEKREEAMREEADIAARAVTQEASHEPSEQAAPAGTVFILAVGKKEGSVLRIGDKRKEL